ncbi:MULTISPECIES: cysteine hydrolase family protein [Anoxynatronum]|uniref:Nicotinamidase-related amidase n=2 Tax=Anoxynatronum TaxID=210622 RepID=A0AA46AHH2_9CLOT|nr:isochorismatase family cysteine hydrolase [Anoxynatronum buryatiense]SMP39643.1 Nicotinamidase-related amidase [Anoxynatronum buryatiense]
MSQKQISDPKALILIDYTHDFVAADGKLTVGEPGQDIEQMIAEKINTYLTEAGYVFVVNDVHDENDTTHPQHRLFPPHNISGTVGRLLYGSIETLVRRLEKEHPEKIIQLDKRRYSAFCGTPLELILRQQGIEQIELAGVCTDICIFHTAVDAYNKGFAVIVNEGAVASFNAEAHNTALAHFETVMGFDVVRRG